MHHQLPLYRFFYTYRYRTQNTQMLISSALNLYLSTKGHFHHLFNDVSIGINTLYTHKLDKET